MSVVRAAFRDECERLGSVLRTLDRSDLDRPTRCVPWTVADLLAHVRTGAGRLADMLAATAPGPAQVDAAGYFGAAKFVPKVDAARIDAARIDAARIDAARVEAARTEAARVEAVPGGGERLAERTGALLDADFDRTWRATLTAVDAHPADRVVRTRHGDAMTVTEFLRTRVVEVGVHGLDLAEALNRPPWLTPTAAQVIAELLTGGQALPVGLGWDRLTLIRKATGRIPRSPAEQHALDTAGIRLLAFGG
ncbi:maleylpyruvate isomerase N-terminal domain-containing protein [Verrucosispora sp. WMMD1129]|uniref:maleylpyruvate isomerase N-terminal domain-containing protein n=1 Tax=Verrucosispora sp. WMMD1129 TaxID=3016093 RepID=UPI002499D7E5|nr:maleylpyruvate isomerase N-terminal domain-containing protein [Verrucosispora sp. WMMD1129]WFE47559.1 maleylpyruvate isomerase N-terminal domain-containing protein [Verrucosispora sp. WMMD1129]